MKTINWNTIAFYSNVIIVLGILRVFSKNQSTPYCHNKYMQGLHSETGNHLPSKCSIHLINSYTCYQYVLHLYQHYPVQQVLHKMQIPIYLRIGCPRSRRVAMARNTSLEISAIDSFLLNGNQFAWIVRTGGFSILSFPLYVLYYRLLESILIFPFCVFYY